MKGPHSAVLSALLLIAPTSQKPFFQPFEQRYNIGNRTKFVLKIIDAELENVFLFFGQF